MRIQNNITAMNTHRQYTINNDNVAKSAEKLSSGYRINRAGDDAAGLAISEKMRSQIRGLNMATKNSQDAISLVQTAEGALQETHSMLQRMNELAVQAATGTNQEEDRLALAKEFQQLKREINDVAEQTTFNNMKILDGSLSYTGYVRSAQTAGVTNTATEIPKDNPISGIQTDAYKPAGTGTAATITFNAGNSTTAPGAGATTNNNGTYSFEVEITNDDGSNTTLTFTANQTGGPGTVGALFASVDDTTGKYTLEMANDGSVSITQKDPDDTTFDESATATIKFDDNTGTANTVAGVTGTVANGKAGAAAIAEKTTAVIDPSKFGAGDVFSIGDYKFQVVKNGGTADTGYNKIELDADGKINLADLSTAIGAATSDGTAAGTAIATDLTVNLNTTSGLLTVTQASAQPAQTGNPPAANTAYKSTKVSFGDPTDKSTSEYKNTIEFDTAKMKDGDEFTLTIGGKDVTVKFDAQKYQTTANKTAAEQFAEDVQKAAEAQGLDVKAKGNAIIYTGEKITEDKMTLNSATEKDATSYPTNAIRIQVGALEDEQLAVSIDAMNTAGLGLDGFTLDSQNEAGMAITAVRAAVQKVSDQRATLGAMQNRLDHKIANLKVSSENLSAAESRIRDVDMASEMTNFTKNNILSQAATAMLAQANSLPQNVLSLLG